MLHSNSHIYCRLTDMLNMNINVQNNYITYLSLYFESSKTYYITVTTNNITHFDMCSTYFIFICKKIFLIDVYFIAGCNVMIRNDKHIVFRRLPRELLREAQRLAGDRMQWMRKLRLLQIWTSHSLQEMPLEQTSLRLSYPSLCQQVQRLLWPALS